MSAGVGVGNFLVTLTPTPARITDSDSDSDSDSAALRIRVEKVTETGVLFYNQVDEVSDSGSGAALCIRHAKIEHMLSRQLYACTHMAQVVSNNTHTHVHAQSI